MIVPHVHFSKRHVRAAMIDAIFFDFGGVIVSSPFEAVAAYEHLDGVPRHFMRSRPVMPRFAQGHQPGAEVSVELTCLSRCKRRERSIEQFGLFLRVDRGLARGG